MDGAEALWTSPLSDRGADEDGGMMMLDMVGTWVLIGQGCFLYCDVSRHGCFYLGKSVLVRERLWCWVIRIRYIR